MFNSLLNTTFDTKRLTELADDKQDYIAHLTSQAGMLQPLNDQFTDSQEITKYILFSERIDVADTDKIVIDSDEYIISEIRDFNFGRFPHYKIYLSKE